MYGIGGKCKPFYCLFWGITQSCLIVSNWTQKYFIMIRLLIVWRDHGWGSSSIWHGDAETGPGKPKETLKDLDYTDELIRAPMDGPKG